MEGNCWNFEQFHCVFFPAYTMAKYGMSMCVLGMSGEFKPLSIAVNALWPRTGELNKMIRICYNLDWDISLNQKILNF